MLHPVEKIFEREELVDRVQMGLIYLRSPVSGKIKRLALWFSGGSGVGNWKFDVRVAGSSQFPDFDDMLTLTDSNSFFAEETGLSVDVEEGDIVLVDLRSMTGGPITPPGTFFMEVDDEVAYVTGAARSTDGTLASNSDAKVPTEKAVKTYVDGSVTGLLDDRGNYDASGDVFPSTGGSGSAGAVKKGDVWTISVAGDLGGDPVVAGDWIRALADTPGQTAGNWAIMPQGGGGGGSTTLAALTDVDVTTTPPTTDDNLTWDGTKWIAQAPGSGATLAGDVTGAATSNLVERVREREFSPDFQPPSAPIVFEDNFDDNAVDPVIWDSNMVLAGVTPGGGVAETGGQLVLTMGGGGGVTGDRLLSLVSMNFTGKTLEIDTPDFLDTLTMVSEGALIRIVDDALAGNSATIRHEQGDWFFDGFNAGTPDRSQPTFYVVDKVRIRHNSPANTWSFYTNIGGAWTLKHTTSAMSWSPTSVKIEIVAYEYHGTPSTHNFILDNLTTDATYIVGTDNMEQGTFPVYDLSDNQFNLGVIKTKSVTTGSVTAGSSSLVTVTWDEAFADAAYIPVVSVLDSTAAVASLRIVKIESITASAITVRVENTSAGNLTGTLKAMAVRL